MQRTAFFIRFFLVISVIPIYVIGNKMEFMAVKLYWFYFCKMRISIFVDMKQ